MKIYPIKAFTDNYIWAIHSSNTNDLIVVDPGDAQVVVDYLEANNLNLKAILITHYHNDHIGGVESLKKQYQCTVYGSSYDQLNFCDTYLSDQNEVTLFDDQLAFKVLHVPGHTLGHIAFYSSAHELLFCGDTLFLAGCGRMFEGEPEQFYQSLQRFAELPPRTKVYCTHEYSLSNLAFAEYLEPNNKNIQMLTDKCIQLRNEDEPTLPSTIASELKTNPFLRCHIPEIQNHIAQLTCRNDKKDYEIFASMRRLKDNF